jgi:hypothetical protein
MYSSLQQGKNNDCRDTAVVGCLAVKIHSCVFSIALTVLPGVLLQEIARANDTDIDASSNVNVRPGGSSWNNDSIEKSMGSSQT